MEDNLNQTSPLKDMHESISAWFLGPRAENFDLLKELFAGAVDSHARVRENYYVEEGVSSFVVSLAHRELIDRVQVFITSSIKESKTYQANVDELRKQTGLIVDLLNQYSVPFFLPRYAGHMGFETYVIYLII